MKLKAFAFVLTAAFCNDSFAAWTPESEILAIRAYPAGNTHYIKFNSNSVNAGCKTTVESGIYVLNDVTGRTYSMILAAQASKQKVSFSVSGCNGTYARIDEVQIGGNWFKRF